jgi:UDP-glucuronate decarboxylase
MTPPLTATNEERGVVERPTALVTGGAGFIGSHLCEALHADGHRVVCLDNLGSGRADNLEGLRGTERFQLVQGDVRDPIGETLAEGTVDGEPVGAETVGTESVGVEPVSTDGVEQWTLADVTGGSIDRIYHLASRASPTDFGSHPLAIAETNSRGTRSVLEFAHSVDARVLLASTSEVYGDPEVHPQTESYTGNVDPRGERAPYDESKRYAEMLAGVYHRQYGLDVRTARIFNTYGPRMRPDDGRVVPTFVAQALTDRPLTVYGDGTQTRSFCYVDDMVWGLRALMEARDAAGEAVNLGGSDEITIESLAELVVDLTDADAGITREPLPHEDDPERRCPDVSRAASELGWEPVVGLRGGLELTVDHFRSTYDEERLEELVA